MLSLCVPSSGFISRSGISSPSRWGLTVRSAPHRWSPFTRSSAPCARVGSTFIRTPGYRTRWEGKLVAIMQQELYTSVLHIHAEVLSLSRKNPTAIIASYAKRTTRSSYIAVYRVQTFFLYSPSIPAQLRRHPCRFLPRPVRAFRYERHPEHRRRLLRHLPGAH